MIQSTINTLDQNEALKPLNTQCGSTSEKPWFFPAIGIRDKIHTKNRTFFCVFDKATFKATFERKACETITQMNEKSAS